MYVTLSMITFFFLSLELRTQKIRLVRGRQLKMQTRHFIENESGKLRSKLVFENVTVNRINTVKTAKVTKMIS